LLKSRQALPAIGSISFAFVVSILFVPGCHSARDTAASTVPNSQPDVLQTNASTLPTGQVEKIFEMGLSSFGDFCLQSN
jgi:hypothetical protein